MDVAAAARESVLPASEHSQESVVEPRTPSSGVQRRRCMGIDSWRGLGGRGRPPLHGLLFGEREHDYAVYFVGFGRGKLQNYAVGILREICFRAADHLSG